MADTAMFARVDKNLGELLTQGCENFAAGKPLL
jgi:hypothetical protein